MKLFPVNEISEIFKNFFFILCFERVWFYLLFFNSYGISKYFSLSVEFVIVKS